MTLSPWQKKQAALLYYFASTDYLKSVKDLIDDVSGLAAGKRAAADAARKRDRRSQTGGTHGFSGWGFIGAFRDSLADDIADRARERFSTTGRNQCERGMAECFIQAPTPQEQERFDLLFGQASKRASNIDQTMNRSYTQAHWSDFCLTLAWKENSAAFTRLPKLLVRDDVCAETRSVPVRTGVYVCADDPNASLQFAWAGGGGGALLECSTLNALGLAALGAVGRAGLWLDEAAMFDFVKANENDALLRSDDYFDDSQAPALAPSLVARQAFTSRACRWFLVESIAGQFENLPPDLPVLRPAPSAKTGWRSASWDAGP